MFEYKTTGKTINEAVENGLRNLNLKRKDVEIKIKKPAKNFQNAVVVLCVPDELVANCEQIERLKSLQTLDNQISFAETLLEKSKTEKNNILENLSAKLLQESDKDLDKNQIVLLIKKFVEGVVLSFDINKYSITAENEDKYVKINITGENLQKLIGFNGKTLASLQFLANVFASKFGRFNFVVHVDINGYKAQKEQKIVDLTTVTVKQVQETKQEATLPPMNAFERRVAHNIVAQFENLTTESVGEEPNRCVVIKLK